MDPVVAGPSWRAFAHEPVWLQYDACIISNAGPRSSYEVYVRGRQIATRARLDEAKEAVEKQFGPLEWSRKRTEPFEVTHYHFGDTTEFTDPVTLHVADLPKIRGVARVIRNSTAGVHRPLPSEPITLYHGTTVEHAEAIKASELRPPAGVNPWTWYMLTTSEEQAARYAMRDDSVVLEFRFTPEQVDQYLGLAQEHNVYGITAEVYGVAHPVPGSLVVATHPVSKGKLASAGGLLEEALWSWKGWPSDMGIHMHDAEHDPTHVPSSGSGKKMRAQAEALLDALSNSGRNTVRLYRGSHVQPEGWKAWTSRKAVATHWATKNGGTVWVLEPGEGQGIRISDYVFSQADEAEREWIARPVGSLTRLAASDYEMDHRPLEDAAPMHDLSATFPDDVYDHPEFYSFGEWTAEAGRVLRQAKGRPEASITIYRAVPEGVDRINTGDWVTTVRSYADLHQEKMARGAQWHIISATVPARTLRTGGNDIIEWGYWGPPTTARTSSTAGPWYHLSDRDLPSGTQLIANDSGWVYFSSDMDIAKIHEVNYDGETAIYEVRPNGEIEDDPSFPGQAQRAHSATVIRRVASGGVVTETEIPLDYPYGGSKLRFAIYDPSVPGDDTVLTNSNTRKRQPSYFAAPGLVAFLDTFTRGDVTFIAYMSVRREHRGRGYARRLVQAVYDHFPSNKIDWGEIMEPEAGHLRDDFAERYPDRGNWYKHRYGSRAVTSAITWTYSEGGTVGNNTHETYEEKGTIPTEVIAKMLGRNGEIPGEHRNKQGQVWEDFKADLTRNGMQHGIFIVVRYGEPIRIWEGNHRRDAAVEMGWPEVPVQIRYFGHSEKQGTLLERWERGEIKPLAGRRNIPGSSREDEIRENHSERGRGRLIERKTWMEGRDRWDFERYETYGEVRIHDGSPKPAASMMSEADWDAMGGAQVGYLGWYYDDISGVITIVDVAEERRRNGLATRMLEYARAHTPVPIEHSNTRNVDGRGWSRAVGTLSATSTLTGKDFQGQYGNTQHITRTEEGTIPTAAIAKMVGARGEIPGEHRNRKGQAWEEFKADIAANGILDPIFITVDPDEMPKISEGNHRRDAAVELGLDEVPVEIRYFGRAEAFGTVMERFERGHLARREVYYHGTFRKLPSGTVLRPSGEMGIADGVWGYGKDEEGSAGSPWVWLTDDPKRAKTWGSDGAWSWARNKGGMDRDRAHELSRQVFVYAVEPMGRLEAHPEMRATDYTAEAARVLYEVDERGREVTASTPISPAELVRSVLARPMATEQIVEETGLGLIEVLEALDEIKASLDTYGSPAQGYTKLWSLGSPERGVTASKTTYYHGTIHDLPEGTLLVPMGDASARRGDRYVHFTTDFDTAFVFAGASSDSGYVYEVEPIGEVEQGRFSKDSFRAHQARIVRKVDLSRMSSQKVAAVDLDAIRSFVEREVAPGYGRGLGACLWVPQRLKQDFGLDTTGGIWWDGPNLASAIEEGSVYEHYWNVLPSGDILDATAGQFFEGDVVRLISRGSPASRHYTRWEDVPPELSDAVDDVIQGSYPTRLIAGKSGAREPLAIERDDHGYRYRVLGGTSTPRVIVEDPAAGGQVGYLSLKRRSWGGEGYEVLSVEVNPAYRRQGVATFMLNLAREHFGTVVHSSDLTDDGKAWSQHVGSWGDDPETQRKLEELAEILTTPTGRPYDPIGDLPDPHAGYGGYISQDRSGNLILDGKPVRKLYRVVDPGEWELAQQRGYLQSHNEYTRASAKPDERWRNQGAAGVRGLTLEIDYDPTDDWHASAEGYAATRTRIPLSRVRKIGAKMASGTEKVLARDWNRGDRAIVARYPDEAGTVVRIEGQGIPYHKVFLTIVFDSDPDRPARYDAKECLRLIDKTAGVDQWSDDGWSVEIPIERPDFRYPWVLVIQRWRSEGGSYSWAVGSGAPGVTSYIATGSAETVEEAEAQGRAAASGSPKMGSRGRGRAKALA